MALPNVNISFANGAIGSVAPSAEGVVGIVAPKASAVTGKFDLDTPYTIYRLSALAPLGIDSTHNGHLYKAVKQFYEEAGDGAELWIYGCTETSTANVLDVEYDTNPTAKNFIAAANGRLRCLAVAHDGSEVFTLSTLIGKAEALAEWATNTMYAPLSVIIGVTAEPSVDLTQLAASRVSILVGSDTASGLPAIGVLAGRIAATAVQEHVGKVRLGALAIEQVYVGANAIDNDKATSLDTLGYITFRTFVGKSGFYFSDDHTACAVSDDYNSLARRRVIDKAYRIVYNTMLEHINEEIPVTEEGTINASYARAWESEVISDVYNEMSVYGNLSTNDGDDKGVECVIDTTNNILSTNTVNVTIRVRPYGYSKYITVNLGFLVDAD